MLNQVILVGTVVDHETLDDKTILSLSTSQKVYGSEQLEENVIDTELNTELWDRLKDLVKKDATIGIKARLKNNGKLLVVTEKVTFINQRQ